MSEAKIQNEIRIGLTKFDIVTFRNQVGQYELKDGRILRSGLCNGSSDLIGWRSLIITPEMVGERIAVFAALEVKSKTGRATAGQKNFCERVIEAGGLAGIVKSLDDAKKVLAID
jgi:hypothetical protein